MRNDRNEMVNFELGEYMGKSFFQKVTQATRMKNIILSRVFTRLPCEQRLHCVSWRAKSSLRRQPFNFLSYMREIRHAIRKQN